MGMPEQAMRIARSEGCWCRHADVLEFLLEKGADPLVTDVIQARTCLHYAALYGWANCITILMERPELRRQQGTPTSAQAIPAPTGHGSQPQNPRWASR